VFGNKINWLVVYSYNIGGTAMQMSQPAMTTGGDSDKEYIHIYNNI